jgi:hypothetical protein
MRKPINRDGELDVRVEGPGEPTPLTTSQKSRVRREFRAAYLIENEAQRNQAITNVYFKFEEMYGISRDQIREIVKKVKREHRSDMHGPRPPKAMGPLPKPKRQPMTCWPWDPRFQPQPTAERRTHQPSETPRSRPKPKRVKESAIPATQAAPTKVVGRRDEPGLPPDAELRPKPRRKGPPIPKWAQRIIDEHGPEYRPTYCPECRRNFRSYVIPQHRDPEGYICKGTMKNGVPKYPLKTADPKPKKVYDDRTPSTSVRTIGGGLPGHGLRC